jgi:CRISPR-associated protein Csh1
MPIGNHDPQLFVTADEINNYRPVLYTHFERVIGLTIDDSDYLPSFSDTLSKPVVFTNYLDAPQYDGGKLIKRSLLKRM